MTYVSRLVAVSGVRSGWLSASRRTWLRVTCEVNVSAQKTTQLLFIHI